MKRLLAITSLLLINSYQAQTWQTDDQYIQKFAQYAVEEMEKYKIPASITLAQGLLETGGGQSRLAQQGNNHFGIKCKEDWTGKTMKHSDDAPNECFRVYDDPKQSYEDHSIFLATRKYYTALFQLDPKDYKAWAFGLKKAGYATNPRYAYILLDKIEKYRLYEFDHISSKEVMLTMLKRYPGLQSDKIFMAQVSQEKVTPPAKPVKVPYKQESFALQQQRVEQIKAKSKGEILSSVLVKNHPNGGLKFFIVPDDIDIALISKKFGIDEFRLMKYNEITDRILKKNDIIFLEPKRPDGNIATYRVEVGESMHDISQKFGLRLSKLYARNRMAEGQQPRIGELIYLQDKKPR